MSDGPVPSRQTSVVVDPWEVLRQIAGSTRTEIQQRQERDRERFHNSALVKDKDYYCVGCWWCCGSVDQEGDRRARAALRANGDDY